MRKIRHLKALHNVCAKPVRHPHNVAALHRHDIETTGDIVAVTLTLVALGAAACLIEHELQANADVVFTVVTTIGAHPLSSLLRRFL